MRRQDARSDASVSGGDGLVLASARGRWVLLATVLGSAIAAIDATVVGVALPAMTGLCVVDQDGQTLFCSHESGAAAVRALTQSAGASSGGRLAFAFENEAYLANYRELFLQPRFGVRGWSTFVLRIRWI